LAAACLFDARKRLLDYLVEMHAQFMTAMQREARNAWEQEHRQARPRVRRGVTVLRELAETILAMVPAPDAPLATLLAQINPHEIADAVKDCVECERLERHGLLDTLHGKYPNFRRYFRAVVDLPFAAEPGSEDLLAGLALLRQLNSGEVKEFPLDVEMSFVPAAWRSRMHVGHRRRWTWEMALALALKDALRSGDVFWPDSRRHVSFWHLCYDEPTWQQTRETAVNTLGLPPEGTAAGQALVREFYETAARTEQGLATNPFARMEDGQLRFRREPRHSEPKGTAALRQLLRRDRARVRIEQLLMDVDAHCGFSRHLVPPLADPAHGEGDPALFLTPAQHYSALMAAPVAHGTNLGIWAMANSTEGLTVRMLQHVSRTDLRDETIRRANAALVNSHRSLAISQCWGEARSPPPMANALGSGKVRCWRLSTLGTLATTTGSSVSTPTSRTNIVSLAPRSSPVPSAKRSMYWTDAWKTRRNCPSGRISWIPMAIRIRCLAFVICWALRLCLA
jgi:hypothetical protein